MSRMQCVFFIGIMKIQIISKYMSVLAPEPHSQKTQTTTTNPSHSSRDWLCAGAREGNPERLCFHTETNISHRNQRSAGLCTEQGPQKASGARREPNGAGDGERSQAGPAQVRERPHLRCARGPGRLCRPHPPLTPPGAPA